MNPIGRTYTTTYMCMCQMCFSQAVSGCDVGLFVTHRIEV